MCMIGLGLAYHWFGVVPLARGALSGMSAVAAGLVLATGLKMTTGLQRHWRGWMFGVLAFVGVGILRWPLLGVVLVLSPLAVAAAWWDEAR
jgi:chromate transporter